MGEEKRVIKPLIRWVGGKKNITKDLMAAMPEKYNQYYEPFFGSGALYFYIGTTLKRSCINDVNPTLMSLYKFIKKDPRGLMVLLSKYQATYNKLKIEEKEVYYYKKRMLYNKLQFNNPERVALFVFLNRAGYNGMYRENASGWFNIPFGKREKVKLYDKENIYLASRLLSKTTITSKNYIFCLNNVSKGDFVYLDPPYYPLNHTSSFTKYNEIDFSKEHQVELKGVVDKLTRIGCYVLLSNSNTGFIKDLYRDYKISSLYANRFVNSKLAGRGKIEELLIKNY